MDGKYVTYFKIEIKSEGNRVDLRQSGIRYESELAPAIATAVDEARDKNKHLWNFTIEVSKDT